MLVIFNIILVVLLIWAAVHDLRTRLIPNRIPALIVLLFLPAALLGYVPQWSTHLLVFGIVFAITATAFALGWMGGGDAKLIPAITLWAGPQHLVLFLLAMALAGGLVAATMLVLRKKSQNTPLGPTGGQDPAAAQDGSAAAYTPSVPYAVAIAIGGGVFLIQPVLNAFGAVLWPVIGNGV
ncbi:type 4 prepilin peptidase 1 [Iodidimonas muriae]|uniref:Type 4 prepilin peptidase 1 n=1 Tax=Iodidimonas muriae TaxID=261467 RepID=A0ABQ2LEY5_9PROT|nr:prepilin peptidase [Iodidimonas muriae]GER07470.1 type 4 prepilin peptidase 1 [Kordiimonadales bacterium JCM 17843]GGO14371.1 type 4 prepilin peptidase 1 [Iodidimonas muriae]